MVYCSARCRAFEWSRANRQFSSAITVADFENVRETIKQFAARMNRVVVGYALIGSHPIAKVARQIGDSTFPPKDRKTKRMPDQSGRTSVRDTPYYSFSPWFEGPRVPVKGKYGLMVFFEGEARLYYSGSDVDVRKAFPAVHFHDEKTGQRYTLKGEVIPPKPPKPPKPPTERKKGKPATAIGPQPERAPSTERVPELVPAIAAQRAPDAELVARVKKLEEEQARQTKERTDLLAAIEKERKEHAAVRQDLEQKLRLAKSMPKPPAKGDGSSRLQAAANRALDQKLREVEKSVGQLQARATEQEQKIGKLEAERDDLAKERTTLARQILKLEDERKEQVTKAERDRTELAAKLPAVELQRDELAAKPAHQAAPAATAAPAAIADGATTDEGADSTPPTSPTGIVIPRLALGGNLPLASSPKTGPPSLGIFGQNHRPPIRGSANRKHKGR